MKTADDSTRGGSTIETARFGRLKIADDHVIEFPLGLLGFPDFKRWAFLQAGQGSAFFWLQSLDAPELAFVVVQPQTFFGDYRVSVQAEELRPIGLDDAADGEVFVICSRTGERVTANLQGPLVFNPRTRQARQVVLCGRGLTTRHELLERQASQRP